MIHPYSQSTRGNVVSNGGLWMEYIEGGGGCECEEMMKAWMREWMRSNDKQMACSLLIRLVIRIDGVNIQLHHVYSCLLGRFHWTWFALDCVEAIRDGLIEKEWEGSSTVFIHDEHTEIESQMNRILCRFSYEKMIPHNSWDGDEGEEET